MNADTTETWSRFRDELRRVVPASRFDVWLAPLSCGGVDREGRLLVIAPDELHGWVAERFAGVLRHAAVAALGRPDAAVELLPARQATKETVRPAVSPAPAEPERESALNPRFTFEQFVIGDTNRFAHAAALAVAEHPAGAYNPLFLYGPPGVGKTHLLHAIGNYLNAYGDGLAVRYATIERFTNEFVRALRHGGIDAFKRRYRHTDVLLVDDVQFLAAKERTEEEFFHTINALHEAGSQLVLTCDRLPHDLDAVAERIRERFAAGLIADMRTPDHATRVAVLRKRAALDGVALDAHVLEVLADRITGNVRALEGALIRVVAFASLNDAPITVELASQVLDGLYGQSERQRRPRSVSVERIQDLVATAFGLTRGELVSPDRSSRVLWPRQIAMFLAREHTGESLPRIGHHFGGRDHTTVLNACRRTAQRLGTDPEAHEAVRALTEAIVRGDADRDG